MLQSALLIFIYATLWFVISIIIKRNDVADIAWGLGYILLCGFYFFTREPTSRALLLYSLIFLWGVRLAIHIFIRNKGKTEDFRYLQWRKDWGKSFFIRSYLQVYLLQGFLLLVIMAPVMIVATHSQPELNLLDYIGIGLWIIGFYFEAIGDAQLVRFKKDPLNKGKIIQSGLWQYTRHPNYFGEVVLWWGIGLIALNSPWGTFGLMGPLMITLLILFVSGVPMMEKKYEGHADYEAYKKRTSRFIPFMRRDPEKRTQD
ncbi:MAG: DUF1295 domain-containing protein [Saprospiraceae bacterium]|nr:DUF1295 domain-containing protein [Saprospiraceae bacterium]